MALRLKLTMSADDLERYFLEHYHMPGEERGWWHGRLVERLGLGHEVARKDFAAIVRNEVPGQPGRCLTQRQNGSRRELVWEKDTETKLWTQVEKDVPNRRVCLDCTFSLTKDQSVYLAASGDKFFEQEIVLPELRARLDAIEAYVAARVRKDSAWENRTTGEALFAVFHDRTTRPIDGIPDPHDHYHCLLINCTWDAVEQEMKASELEELFAFKAYQECLWHARINERALDAGYGMRRTDKGLELSVFSPGECKIFSKRTAEITRLEERLRADLTRQAKAIVASEARDGRVINFESQYAKLKDQLGEKCRQGKNQALYNEGPELRAQWEKQLAPGRWQAITPEAARSAERIGFLTPEEAKKLTIAHLFASKSEVRDVDLFKEACRYCEGAMRVAEIDLFRRQDPRLMRNPAKPGFVTTVEILQEEQRIRDTVVAGKDVRESVGQGRRWEVRDNQLDEGQLAAVKLILESRDMVIAIPGRTGAGKSRTVAEAAHAIRTLTGQDPFVLAPQGKQAIALSKAIGGTGAHTIAGLRAHKGWQARGRNGTLTPGSCHGSDSPIADAQEARVATSVGPR